WRVIAQGPDQGAELAARLRSILADEATYSRSHKMCFWPGVAFRVHSGDEVVDVLVCFYCDNLYCGPPRDLAPNAENLSFDGSPRRADLVRLAKEAFPDDKEIQALED